MPDYLKCEEKLRKQFLLHWPNKYFTGNLSARTFKGLINQTPLADISSLLTTFRGSIQGWKGQESITIEAVSVPDALAVFREGMSTLKFEGIHRYIPQLTEFMKEIAAFVRTPMNRMYCNAYLSPKGKKTAMHFDEQEVLILHLQGEKLWQVAENKSVQYPTFGYTGAPVDDCFMRQVDTEFPKQMPNPKKHLLQPGKMLFLPRGTWHQTEAMTECLGLTFTFESKTRVDIATQLIQNTLLLNTEWRTVSASMNQASENYNFIEINNINVLLKNFGKKLARNGILTLVDMSDTKT